MAGCPFSHQPTQIRKRRWNLETSSAVVEFRLCTFFSTSVTFSVHQFIFFFCRTKPHCQSNMAACEYEIWKLSAELMNACERMMLAVPDALFLILLRKKTGNRSLQKKETIALHLYSRLFYEGIQQW